MRIVVDTNVLVSGLLNPRGAPADVLRIVLAGEAVLCHDPRILAEYREVLRRPAFPFDPSDVATLLEVLATLGESVTAPPLSVELPDPDDAPFLEVAAVADYLITGNRRHFPPEARGVVKVVSPDEFITAWRQRCEQ